MSASGTYNYPQDEDAGHGLLDPNVVIHHTKDFGTNALEKYSVLVAKATQYLERIETAVKKKKELEKAVKNNQELEKAVEHNQELEKAAKGFYELYDRINKVSIQAGLHGGPVEITEIITRKVAAKLYDRINICVKTDVGRNLMRSITRLLTRLAMGLEMLSDGLTSSDKTSNKVAIQSIARELEKNEDLERLATDCKAMWWSLGQATITIVVPTNKDKDAQQDQLAIADS